MSSVTVVGSSVRFAVAANEVALSSDALAVRASVLAVLASDLAQRPGELAELSNGLERFAQRLIGRADGPSRRASNARGTRMRMQGERGAPANDRCKLFREPSAKTKEQNALAGQ